MIPPEMEFLLQHQNADEIVMDADTGLPVKAVYSGPTRFGQIRTYPAVYWFYAPCDNPYWGR